MRQPILLFITLLLSVAARTQVQVSEEPRHHKVLANKWVRVLDVHVPPHDTTLMHKHSTPSVFIILSNTRTGSQVLVEPGKPSFADGNIWFESFKDTPRIHRVWNEDTVEFHVMDIELPHARVPAFQMQPPFSKLAVAAVPVRVYRMTLPPGQHVTILAGQAKALPPSRENPYPRSQTPILIVSLSGPSANASVNKHPFTRKGDFLFIPGDGDLEIENNSTSTDHQFALLYLQ